MATEFDNKRLKRLYHLDNLLKDDKGFTRKELENKISEQLGESVDRYSIRRDLELLEKGLGKRIIYDQHIVQDFKNEQDRRVERIRYPDPSESLFSVNLNEDQIGYLSTAMAVMGLKGLEQTKMFRGLNLTTKGNLTQISYTKNPKEKAIGKVFYDIYIAIKSKHPINLTLRDRRDPSIKKKHRVHPWYLREYNRRWYLFGYDEGEKAMMHYCLDRIVGKIRDYDSKVGWQKPMGSIDYLLKDVIGVSIPDEEKIEVLLWVSVESADFVSNKPMHHSQEEIDAEDERVKPFVSRLPPGGKFFSLRCKDNYELRREMISFGPELIVLFPDSFRRNLHERLKKMVSNYEKFLHE